MSAETSIASARASVMIYDDASKKWLPSGTSSGLSRVHIYQNTQNNTFRVVGRKLQDHEVVINSVILKNLKYNQATPIFHQWRENRQVYGLNFSAKEEADAFAHTMLKVIDLLNQATYGASKQMAPLQSSQQQPVYGHIGPPDEYGDMRQSGGSQPNGWHQNGNSLHGMDPNSGAMHHPAMAPGQPPIHQMMGEMHLNGSMITSTQPTYMSTAHLMQQRSPNPTAVTSTPPVQTIMASPMSAQTVTSAPPPPPPPPGNLMIGSNAMPPSNNAVSNSIPPQATPPMGASSVSQNNSPSIPVGGAAPPPPPPPPPPGLFGGSADKPSPPNGSSQSTNNLAAAIANARLKRTTSIKEGESESTPRNSAPKGGNLMDEMAKTLARRRAQAERVDQNDGNDSNTPKFSSPASKSGPEPKVNGFSPSKDDSNSVKRNGVSDDSSKLNFSESDLDRFKQEIMTNIKKELQRFKLDIIDAIKSELNRR